MNKQKNNPLLYHKWHKVSLHNHFQYYQAVILKFAFLNYFISNNVKETQKHQ